MNLTQLADWCGTDKGSHQSYTKWYERYLPGADQPVTLVELGVDQGNSMKMWLHYFRHANTRIIGIDQTLSENALYRDDYNGVANLFTADQADFQVAATITAMLPVDVVIDDASHQGDKTAASFEVWWPHLLPGGLYVVEDTHCSYDTDHYRTAGKPGQQGTMMDFLKRLADDVNWGIHGYDRFHRMAQDVAYVHFYPGIAFIGKRES